MRRLKLLSGGREPEDRGPHAGADDPVTRGLRELYAPPPDGYWDTLEARVMAAVRAGRGAPTAVAEWWQTLAEWARPGLAAACLLLGVVSVAALQARAAARAARQPSEIVPLDADLARALDLVTADSALAAETRDAREGADLLIDGVYRRPVLLLPQREPARRSAVDDERDEVLRARREATFRYVMP